MKEPLLIVALRRLPKNAMSRVMGRLAEVHWPAPIQRRLVRLFSASVGIDLSEIKEPIGSFSCMQDFFTRELKHGLRPLPADPRAFVSPCDGAWGQSGIVECGMLLQIKGRPYSLAALLGNKAQARHYEGGWFATIYLSPKDYHRFHAPCDARVKRLRYLPGTLWPVNRAGIEGVDGLFAENERLCAFMDLEGENGEEGLCIAAVGATLVGKVKVNFDSLTTNIAGSQTSERLYKDREIFLERGQELGRFEFGSTLVLVGRPGLVDFEPGEPGAPVRFGEEIGRFAELPKSQPSPGATY